MGIGAGIFLIAVGAILSFGVRDKVSDIDLTVIGYILMAAGAVGIILGFIMMRQGQRTSHVNVQERRTVEDGQEVLNDRSVASDQQYPDSTPPGGQPRA